MILMMFICLLAFLLLQNVHTTDTFIEHYRKDTFQEYNLKAHNIIRKLHGVPELELDQEMSHLAELYVANRMLTHREFSPPYDAAMKLRASVGENLSVRCQEEGEPFKDITFPIQRWYDELCKYDYDFKLADDNPELTRTNRFTQMVWKNSTKLGIGRVYRNVLRDKTRLRCQYVVAWYKPEGNVPGKYEDNVLKGSFDKDVCKKLPQMLVGDEKETKT